VSAPRVLLINPTMTARRHARFPLSLLALAGELEGKYDTTLIDGNVERDTVDAVARANGNGTFDAVGISVMGGPQVESAIALSQAVRETMPGVPIVWGGYFPSLYPAVASSAPYVDFAVRGAGEQTFAELLGRLGDGERSDFDGIAGLSWRRDREIVHNADRPIVGRRSSSVPSYRLMDHPGSYLARTTLGQRTAAHQGALGCRFRCTFCGVASMFRGVTALPAPEVLERDLLYLRDVLGADSIQFYDHNFFDREVEMVPLLEVMAKIALPWWCYARSDALLGLSSRSWSLVRQSRLRMAYIGAESPNDQLLREIRKGTRADETLAVVELCRRHGVIPELSFMVAPPVDPVGETERTFDFIREVKRINPQAEIVVYIYTPLPPESVPASARARLTPLRDALGNPLAFPTSPEEWTERRWVDYACHADAPWLTDKLRQRIRDFVTVMRCRFPTVMDVRSPRWATAALRTAAAWRYRYKRYNHPWELNVAQRLLRPADPRITGL
jgi:anaerobic magnesium-protoporphyrin IX monomethyl ester cyclase